MKPIRYRVLLAEQLSASDKLTVTARVNSIFTGDEAKLAAFRIDKVTHESVNQGWQFEVLDNLGRVAALRYKGCEVAIFVKRQVTEVELLKGDPIPEGVIKDPADAWVRVDVLGASARKVGSKVGKERKSALEELTLVEKRLQLSERIKDQVETENLKLKQAVEESHAQIQELKSKIRRIQRERRNESGPEHVQVGIQMG